MNRVLSQEEIEALLQSLSEGEANCAGVPGAGPEGVGDVTCLTPLGGAAGAQPCPDWRHFPVRRKWPGDRLAKDYQ
jgi:hypothetical protein